MEGFLGVRWGDLRGVPTTLRNTHVGLFPPPIPALVRIAMYVYRAKQVPAFTSYSPKSITMAALLSLPFIPFFFFLKQCNSWNCILLLANKERVDVDLLSSQTQEKAESTLCSTTH